MNLVHSIRFLMILQLILLMVSVFPLVFGQNTAMIGVEVGDWVKYDIKRNGEPPVQGTLPQERSVWVKVEVLNFSGTICSVRETSHLPDGSEENDILIWDLQDTSDGFSRYVHCANLSAGDKIGELGPLDTALPILINTTVWRSYGSTTRMVNMLNISYVDSVLGHSLNRTLEFYWDKHTGFLLEKTMQMYDLDYGNSSLFVETWKISDTNLWEMKGSEGGPLVLGLVALILVIGSVGMATLHRSVKNGKTKTKRHEKC